MFDRLNKLSTPILLVCALALTALVARRELLGSGRPASRAPVPPATIANWRAIADAGTRIGPASAPITITEFSDFQCPWCKRFHATLQQLMAKYPGQITVSYRHFPIERIHRFAREAAAASECAAREGRFQQFADLAFAQQDSIGKLSFVEFARRAGVEDTTAFAACISSPAVSARIEADIAAAKEIKINGTPTVLFNEMRFSGAPSLDRLDSLVSRQLAKKR